MSWQDLPRPDGIDRITETDDGFEAAISIPLDEDGYFGRECPSCEAPFKMRHDEYEALPEELELTCPYCGHREEHSAFMSRAQMQRVRAAAGGLAEQWMHREIGDMFGRTFGRRRSGSSLGVTYTPGSPPPVKALPDVVEKATRRIIECSTCGNHHAVYSATSFCPVCGPRPAKEKVLEAIAAAREALSLEDHLEGERREIVRATGAFERLAVDAIESTVSLFEIFAREQFSHRVGNAEQVTAGRGNIFQRLDDTVALFFDHAGIDLPANVGGDRWQRLKQAFTQRHVFTHRGGIVDQRFLDQVPGSSLKLGQRLVIRRADGETALDDLEAAVQAISEA